MSYRLITKAIFSVTDAQGKASERQVECRLYPAPKREASGTISVDGVDVQYRRTGGKGRGTVSNAYAYATVKGESAFWLITEAEAAALIGGKATIKSVAAEEVKAPEAKPEAAEQAKEEPKAEVKKAARRIKAKDAAKAE